VIGPRGLDDLPELSALEKRNGCRLAATEHIARIEVNRATAIEISIAITELRGEFRSRVVLAIALCGARPRIYRIGFLSVPRVIDALQRARSRGDVLREDHQARAAQNGSDKRVA